MRTRCRPSAPPVHSLKIQGIAMPSCSHVDPARVFTSLADIVHQGSTPNETYAAICVAATLMVPGCDHASLMICRDGACSTAAVSDPVARKIDELEQALGSGPCLDAIEEQTAQLASDLTTSSPWPTLAARVLAETPVRGAMSIRVPVDRAKSAPLTCSPIRSMRSTTRRLNGPSCWPRSPRWLPKPQRMAKTRPRCGGGWSATARSARPSAC